MIDPQEYFLASHQPDGREDRAHLRDLSQGTLQGERAGLRRSAAGDGAPAEGRSAEVRERYNRRYKYLLIDEYQDTNRPQYELMKLLAGQHDNVCVVGDEDQSIYSWRGADIKNILEFEKDFPEREDDSPGAELPLHADHSRRRIARWWRSNTQRKGKKLWTTREGGSLIGYYEAPDGENEALFIADRIQRYLREAGGQRGSAAVRRALPHQLAVAAGGRGAAPLSDPVPHGRRLLASTTAPRSRTS